MSDLKTIRELRKVLEHTQSLINNLTPEPNIMQISCEPQFELGTRLVTATGARYRYVKLDFGVVGKTDEGEELRNIHYRWI